MPKKTLKLFLLFVSIFLFSPQKAHAYLDPGSGSYLVQILIASVAGIGYFLKINWGKIKNIFLREKTQKTDNEKSNK